jgi:hypothetical protein
VAEHESSVWPEMTYSAQKRDQMLETYAELRSIPRTAERLGVGSGTVANVLREKGVSRRPIGGVRKDPGQPPRWARRKASNGYITWYGWIGGKDRYATLSEHRLLVEREIGRPLHRSEQVHHKNGLRDDNRLDNLELRLGNHGSGATHCPHCGGSLVVPLESA